MIRTRGEAGAATADFLMRTLGVRLEHARYLSRDDLLASTRALDRVLLWNHYVVPQWNYPKLRSARWDRFSHPEQLPKYGLSGFPDIWWWDAAKAAKTGGRS